jgi:phytoene dehydrogenase-like protein
MIYNPALRFSTKHILPSKAEVVVIGAGMASLTAAALLAGKGRDVLVLERNYLPGGCASSYKRKEYIFESGATTLVGLDQGMPLRQVLDETGISFNYRRLEIPMKVILSDGTVVTRYNKLNEWIKESEKIFGSAGQKHFWTTCYNISKKVWSASGRQLYFPPSGTTDLIKMALNSRLSDFSLLPYFNKTLKSLLAEHGLLENKRFLEFIDEQLLITAQNKHLDVDVLFGATALCYTLFGNYYADGGLIEMAGAFVKFIEDKGGKVIHRVEVTAVSEKGNRFQIDSGEGLIEASAIVSGIPLNNFVRLIENKEQLKTIAIRESSELYSAFQAGIVFRSQPSAGCLHYQIHVEGLPGLPDCRSFFVSFSHPEDRLRCEQGLTVASISLHVPDPANSLIDKSLIFDSIVSILDRHQLILKKDIVYSHASGPGDWESWTGRFAGFVGGYPQTLKVKPWKMQKSVISPGLFVCGDCVYPGQGIPGVSLSGRIAATRALDYLK